MITITLENRDQDDLFVSVTDLNRAGSPEVLTKQRINMRNSFPIDVQEDGHGCGNIKWTAQRINTSKTVQHNATPKAGDTVEVTTFFG